MLDRSIKVTRTFTEVGRNVALGPPKTAAAVRSVSLPRFLVDVLARHLERYPSTEMELVFSAPDGGSLRRTNFRRRVWVPAVAASVGQPMRFHDLRHTHAAILIGQGEHPKVIQSRLGHASIKTTLDTYGHLFEGLDEAAADRMDERYRGSLVDTMWTPGGVENLHPSS